MKNWEKFEDEAVEYLNKKISLFSFLKQGGSNSNSEDIRIEKNGDLINTNIEAKLSPSQSGQFVIFEKKNQYFISTKNKRYNPISKLILENLNCEFHKYSLSKKNSVIQIKKINKLLAKWIESHYLSKNSLFLITSNKLSSFKCIVPVKQIKKFFEISACIRKKKSGTGSAEERRQNHCRILL